MSSTRRILLVVISGLAAAFLDMSSQLTIADQPLTNQADKPSLGAELPWKRVLKEDDAKKVGELDEKITDLRIAGKYAEAIVAGREILTIRSRVQGKDHWETGDARRLVQILEQIAALPSEAQADLSLAVKLDGEKQRLFKQGRYAEALPIAWRAFDLRRRHLGEEHLEVAFAANSLAETLYGAGKHIEAEPLFQKALAIFQKVLGEEHPDMARGYNNLALNLNALGKYGAAEPLLQKALASKRKVLGEEHPDTANGYGNLASNLNAQGKYEAAEPLFEKSLHIRRKVLGDEHAETARGYNNLALNLYAQAKYAEAGPLFEKSLDTRRKVLGEEHADTARGYNNLALNLYAQGKYAAAEPLYQKALNIWRKVLGEDHPDTANGYNNLAMNLNAQAKYATAEPFFQKALFVWRHVFGEEHPQTANGYNNMAGNLHDQGKYAIAEPLFQKVLAIKRKMLGEKHPETARAYANLAGNLDFQTKYAAAEPHHQKALDIRRNSLGREHPDTARSYANLARHLDAQGKYAAAEPHHQKALDIRRKALGEEHPDTAISYNNVAMNQNAQGKYAAAEPGLQKSLAIRRKVHGEEHPDTAQSYNNLAANQNAQGNYADAEKLWTYGAEVFAEARLRLAGSGLERAAITTERSYLPELAAVLARNGKPRSAWQRFEESLARGTWDDLSTRLRRPAVERDRQTSLVQGLNRLDQLIERTFTGKETSEVKKKRDELLSQRRKLQDELHYFTLEMEKKYGPAAGQVFDQADIQKALPADAALVGWLDIAGQPKAADPNGEHWAFLLRAQGDPICVRLPGSGKDNAWTEADTRLPALLRQAIQAPTSDWQPLRARGLEFVKDDFGHLGGVELADRLRRQRLEPLGKRLATTGNLPAVRRLIVLPSPALAGVPVEVFAGDYTVSYALSGTLFAHLSRQPKLTSEGLLALAAPVFKTVPAPGSDAVRLIPLPPAGALVTMVAPGSKAELAGLRRGDVVLRYGQAQIAGPADLKPLPESNDPATFVDVEIWREGKTLGKRLRPGKLGVGIANDPAPQALAESRRMDELLAKSRGDEDGEWPPLPGTRVETEALHRLCQESAIPFRLLAESQASEQELYEQARSKDNALAKYRYIHLATHGTIDDRFPLRSAVILSRDKLPDPLKQLEAGQPVFDGRLTAQKVLEHWNLQAELVTLSACQTALGKYERGEGFVGFTNALLLCGSRAVCLSLWKVDDTATALLMVRFYENLLGKRPGLKAPMPKAEALREGKEWLRGLKVEEVEALAAKLPATPQGERMKVASGPSARPYEHPYYWAAFVLVGAAE